MQECQTCAGRSDWDFLRGFYEREDFNRQKVQSLSSHIEELKRALQHSGLTSQKDRVALNSAHEQMKQMQYAFQESEIIRARSENNFHEERQAHCMCQKVLKDERLRCEDLENRLIIMRDSQNNLQNMVSSVQPQGDNADLDIESNITRMVVQIAAKTNKITSLETALREEKEHSTLTIQCSNEKLHNIATQHEAELIAKDITINELELRLCQLQKANASGLVSPNQSQSSRGGKRSKRQYGRGQRGNKRDLSKSDQIVPGEAHLTKEAAATS